MAASCEDLARLLNLNRDDSSALSEEFHNFFDERDDSDGSSTSEDDHSDGKFIFMTEILPFIFSFSRSHRLVHDRVDIKPSATASARSSLK